MTRPPRTACRHPTTRSQRPPSWQRQVRSAACRHNPAILAQQHPHCSFVHCSVQLRVLMDAKTVARVTTVTGCEVNFEASPDC